jgi:anaerobic selenocysteine-containing dehydrogenase
VLSSPNGRRLDSALETLDFMVSVDLYVNETTRHADVILPTTTTLERDHYDMIFNILSVRNVARYSPAVFPKPEGMLHDWEVLQRAGDALAAALGIAPKPATTPQAIVDAGLRAGPYALSLDRLRAAPHGLDLGPLAPSFPERLATPAKRIACAPAPLLDALRAAAPALFEPRAADELLLIGRRDLRSNNSWMHNYSRLVKGKDRCTLFVHPNDVARWGLVDGGRARVVSRAGFVEAEVHATEDVMPGVVSLPHGWGHDRPGARAAVAREHAGVSANDVTDETYRDAVSGTAALNGVPVRLEALVPA